MAEVGLIGFARVALDVARSVLPDYRSKFSKHVFTQPQLLAVVCLMRYEGWTLRKAEVRLAEHRQLRVALGLDKAPDYTTLHRFLNRLEEAVLVRALGETVRRALCLHHATLTPTTISESPKRSLQWMRAGCLRVRSAPFTYSAHKTAMVSPCSGAGG
jgi:hypothetical protein